MPSFGEELKRERELREISLREVAEATKVNIHYLEAMERNDFDRLPGGVFNRGFVRAYAQFIGIDPEAMVNAYLLEERGRSQPRAGSDGGVLRGSGRSADKRKAEASPAERKARKGGRWAWILLLLAAIVVLTVIVVNLASGGGLDGALR